MLPSPQYKTFQPFTHHNNFVERNRPTIAQPLFDSEDAAMVKSKENRLLLKAQNSDIYLEAVVQSLVMSLLHFFSSEQLELYYSLNKYLQ